LNSAVRLAAAQDLAQSPDIRTLEQGDHHNDLDGNKFSEETTWVKFSVATQGIAGEVKLTAPKKCSICIRFAESKRPILVVTTDTDVKEIALEKKRAFLRKGWASALTAETPSVVLQTWPSSEEAWVLFCSSWGAAKSSLDALEAAGCIRTNLTQQCQIVSTTPVGAHAVCSSVFRARMTVHTAEDEPGHDVVLKIAKPNSEELLINEILKVGFLLRNKTLCEKHIVNTRGLYEMRLDGQLTLATVLEYVPGGDLASRVPSGGMAEAEARGLFQQLFSAVVGLATVGMVHRDIKPGNILCDMRADGSVRARLIDFALAVFLDDEEGITCRCGTPGFIAPEILRERPLATSKSDCFSLGATLFFAVTGGNPFGSDLLDDKKALLRNLQGFKAEGSGLSVQLEDLLCRLGQADPDERLSASEALAHPWFTEHAP
jgi:serine/threonine protein kinase